jgi:hypothetical protein
LLYLQLFPFLTILTKHIEGMEITGDKAKLENLVRSLYTEALDA